MSLALKHRERTLAMQSASAPDMGGGLAPRGNARRDPADAAAAEMRLRLRHDRQRLKQIKSTKLKVEAKRQMLPAYTAWIDGILEAGRCTVGRELSPGAAPEILPTMMVWSIDTGDWSRALDLAEHVLRFNVALPDHFKRDAATLIVEDIAEAAQAEQLAGNVFPMAVLERVETLTFGIDMHDEVQAKLCKVIGVELARTAGEVDTGTDDFIAAATRALEPLRKAQALHTRSGTKTKVAQLEKAIKSATLAQAMLATAIAAPVPETGNSNDEPNEEN